MKKMFTSAVMAFVVLAACNTNPTTNPITNIETSKQPSIDSKKSQVLGVLEVELSSEQGSVSSATFIPTGSTGLSAKGVAVPITAANWVFTPGTTTYMTDANFKYLQNTITLENKTGTSFSNLAMYALNTPSNIGGTAFSAVKTLAGVALTGTAASNVARAVMPTHGMTNTTTVDPNKADLMLYTPSEAAAVQAQLIAPNFALSSPTVLEYGFLARNLAAGARAIGTSAAACPSGPTCNKATITWAFKFPLSLANSSTLGKFTLKYVVVNEPGSFAVQSLEEQAINTTSGATTIAATDQARVLAGSTISYPKNLKSLCRAKTATSPNAFLGPNPIPAATPGSLDVCGFGASGKRTFTILAGASSDGGGRGIAVQADGKILVSGGYRISSEYYGYHGYIARLLPNGDPDTSFGPNGNGRALITDSGNSYEEYVSVITIQNDGKILVLGRRNGLETICRFKADGSRDIINFGGNLGCIGLNGSGYDLKVQSDGKILWFGGYSVDFAVQRFNSNGNVDYGFGINGIVQTKFENDTALGSFGGLAYSGAVQSDGKIVAAGRSRHDSTGYDFTIARYNTDGSLDFKFVKSLGNTQSYKDDEAKSVLIQSDGKIIALGRAYVFRDTPGGGTYDFQFSLLRIDQNGQLDNGFGGNGTGFNFTRIRDSSEILASKLQSDGKIVAVGKATSDNYQLGTALTVARYTNSGILDTTFNATGIVQEQYDPIKTYYGALGNAVDIQSDGKIVTAGPAAIYGQDLAFGIMRFNP
jgi:uncharacterized delta-60 repeat protein